MKKLMLSTVVFVSAMAAHAASYSYYSNPTYCKASWNCDIVSADFSEAAYFCSTQGFYIGTATVYEYANERKAALKGYGCLEHN